MEDYLKNLLDDLDQSQSSEVRIIDDNFNSSFGSLKDHRRRRDERRRGVRRTKSLNTKVVFDKAATNDDDDDVEDNLEESSRSLNLTDCVESEMSVTKTTKNKKSGVQLSARMERHRQTRWSAADIPTSPVRHSLSPGVLRGRRRYTSVPKVEPLHSSLELGNQVISRRQRKAISIVRDFASSDDREGISCSRDYNGDRAISDRFSTVSLSADLFEIGDASLSNESVINEAIAISWEQTMGVTRAKETKSKTRARRVRRSRDSKVQSMGSTRAPPSIPVRKGSLERSRERPSSIEESSSAKTRLQVPSKPVRRRSMDNGYDDPEEDTHVSPKFEQTTKLEIPIVLRDLLPYQKGRKTF